MQADRNIFCFSSKNEKIIFWSYWFMYQGGHQRCEYALILSVEDPASLPLARHLSGEDPVSLPLLR